MLRFTAKLYGIVWETDNQKVDLPKKMQVSIKIHEENDDEIGDAAVEAATQATGWLISSVEKITYSKI